MAKNNQQANKPFTPKNPTKTWWGKVLLWIIIIGFSLIPIVSLIWVLATL